VKVNLIILAGAAQADKMATSNSRAIYMTSISVIVALLFDCPIVLAGLTVAMVPETIYLYRLACPPYKVVPHSLSWDWSVWYPEAVHLLVYLGVISIDTCMHNS